MVCRYLNNFSKEARRLHNASFRPGRTTKTDIVLPACYRLPADAFIIPASYAIHTNPAVWHDPFRFDPDRLDDEEGKSQDPSLRVDTLVWFTRAEEAVEYDLSSVDRAVGPLLHREKETTVTFELCSFVILTT